MSHSPWNGSIEVIVGSMFSGKTEELIRRMKRALIARQLIIVILKKIFILIAIKKFKHLLLKKHRIF